MINTNHPSPLTAEKLLLDSDIYKYHFVSQGKIDIPNVDDGEEARLTDVKYHSMRHPFSHIS